MITRAWLALAGAALLSGQAARPQAITVRGRPQVVRCYAAVGHQRAQVLFLPGDGGWRGFAVEMAETLARAGFHVCGWDIKEYLSGFTDGRATLREEDVQSDTAALARGLGGGKWVLAGWSQGAAMSVLAAAANQDLYSGAVAVGLPERGVLGWRWQDNLTYLTKAQPGEPQFQTERWLPKMAPLRLSMLYSSSDEYVSGEAARRLFARAAEPKRIRYVNARNHRYDGNQGEFLRALTEETAWVAREESRP